MRSCGHYAGERELLSIIRRIDTDGDARLSFAEFSEFLRGPCPGPIPELIPVRPPSPRPVPIYHSPCRTVYCSPIRGPPPPLPRPCSAPRVRHGSPVRSCHSRRPLHLPEEDALVTAIKDLCSAEREMEAQKTALTLKSDFNLVDCFHIFDINRDGFVDTHELRQGLSAIGVHPTSEDIELFMTRYD